MSEAQKQWAATAGTGVAETSWFSDLSTLFLVSVCPVAVFFFHYVYTVLGGNEMALVHEIWAGGDLRAGFAAVFSKVPPQTPRAWATIGVWAAYGMASQLLVPGKEFRGPISPKGNVPVYKANGFQCYLLTLALFFGGWHQGWFNPAQVVDDLGSIFTCLNISSLLFCVFLTLKGLYFPSSSDAGSSGSLIYDYYWGTELYPRVGPLDIKVWTNCRFGMMGWAMLILCYAAKQLEATGTISDSMLVSVGLQQLYIAKFFLWEAGYWCTMDICHDRAGFYICWGCLVWVPSLYTSPAWYLVKNPVTLGPVLASMIFVAGAAMIYLNYDCDRQRKVFRATNGQTPVWGQLPTFIEAYYTTAKGKTQKSLLLTSGWWAVARHFHYAPEITAAFCWSVPALFENVSAYLYVIFLTVLLVHRAYRDDERCRSKYGKYWEQYCEVVPYKILPFLI